jgi:hypothetical protein
MGLIRQIFGKGRRGAVDSNLPRTAEGAAARVRLNRSGEADRTVPATQMMKKGGAVKKTAKTSDATGRALKRTTADAKGRATKSAKSAKKGK